MKEIWLCALFTLGVLIVDRLPYRVWLLPLLNLCLVSEIFKNFWGPSNGIYFAFIAIELLALHFFVKNKNKTLASFVWIFPLLVLVIVKATFVTKWVGISYLAFKMLYLSAEISHAKTDDDKPSWHEALNFFLFLPVFFMGPIFRLRDFRKAMRNRKPIDFGYIPRIAWGAAQWFWVSESLAPLSFESYFLDGYKHGGWDFLLCCFAGLLEVYFKFNGFMDIALGTCNLLGWHLPENFNEPFKARNMREFWNRWHITLNHFMRDMVFLPFSKFISKRYSWNIHVTICLSFVLTFALTGIWHGFAVNYLLYGLFHGLSLVIHYMWTLELKRRNVNIKTYEANTAILWASRVITLTFMALSMFFFQNSISGMGKVLKALVW